jgi:hypothetical protein
MPETATWLAAAASDQQGPGYTLRLVLLGSMVGVVLLAWFLLRGYRKDNGGGGSAADSGGASGGASGGEVRSEVSGAAGKDDSANN